MPNLAPGALVTAAEFNAICPVGVILPYGGASAPSGWLIADGSAVSRTTYADLFAAHGTAFGVGDGSTTFNLPDGRGRSMFGYAPSGGHVDVSTIGNNDGVAVAFRRPKHRHTPHTHTVGVSASLFPSGSGGAVAASGSTTTSSNDGGSANANDPLDSPAYLVVNHIVKT